MITLTAGTQLSLSNLKMENIKETREKISFGVSLMNSEITNTVILKRKKFVLRKVSSWGTRTTLETIMRSEASALIR